MKFFRHFIWALLLFGIIKPSFSQDYGPMRLKNQDIKLLKGKVLYIPTYDERQGWCKVFIDPSIFKNCKTDKKVQDAYQSRWDSAISMSTYDLTSYEFKFIDRNKFEKDKDKVAIAMYFDHDFYDNWYVYLAVYEPKMEVIATAPINGVDLGNIEDLKTMMNMLTYSMINTFSYYGDDIKPLYKGHENKYQKFINGFSDSIKQKTLLIPQFDKERKNFKKYNEKLSEYLKQNWKLTKYEFLPLTEYKKRVAQARPNDCYLKLYNLNTDNSLITYHYYAIMTTTNNYMVHGYTGLQYLLPGNIKYFQVFMERWMYKFKEKVKRDKYIWITKPPKEVRKQQPIQATQTKSTTPVKQTTTQPKKTEPQKKSTTPKTKTDTKNKTPQPINQTKNKK